MGSEETNRKSRMERLRSILVDDSQRKNLIFFCFNLLFIFVAGFMSVVNIFTQKWLLCASTSLFTLACGFNLWYARRGEREKRVSHYLFLTESVILCGFFCVTGTPEGFSALWTCFIPSFSFVLLGLRLGGVYSGIGFLMIVFCFWTPLGRSLLQYDYTQSFMLRFPMIYAAFTLLAAFLEYVREETQRQLREAERRYQHLYRHDALTGIQNRYGFDEKLASFFQDPEVGTVTLMIADLDLFKRINDTYGHDGGDEVLRAVAAALERLTGDREAVSRWGGEEFTLLLRDLPDPEGLGEKIRQAVEETEIQVEERTVKVTLTVGICTVSDLRRVGSARLVRAADQCLYAAKAEGGNRVKATRL